MYDDNAISKVTMLLLLHYSRYRKGIQMPIEVGKLRLRYPVGEVRHYNCSRNNSRKDSNKTKIDLLHY